MDYSVQRKVLRMVSSLHLRGYQRLRIAPGSAPNGMSWRCTVTPVTNISRRHGARLIDWDTLTAHYTSGMKAEYFDWTDAVRATPGDLATLFIQRFPEIARAGYGADWEYAGWYLHMLHLTHPDRFPIAYDDGGCPDDCLVTEGGEPRARIPLPPPGLGTSRDGPDSDQE